MSSSDELFYELRLYSIAPGRLADMASRFSDDLNTLFPKHGVLPLAGWTATAGMGLPKFVYMMPWCSLEQRSQALSAFATDPEWAEVRRRTNGPSELVERYDIHLLKAITPVRPIGQERGDTKAVYELAIQQVANGHAAGARQTLLEVQLPAYVSAGATVVAAFDMLFGPQLPAVVTLLKWQDQAARAAGLLAVEADASLHQVRQQQIAQQGRCLLGHADGYLLDIVDVQWAALAQ